MTTPSPETLLALAERVEALEGPDWNVDRDIFHAVPFGTSGNIAGVPRYTKSLDAAMTLIRDEWDFTIERDGAWIRWLTAGDVGEAQSVLLARGGKCTPIALTAASLRALASAAKEMQRG